MNKIIIKKTLKSLATECSEMGVSYKRKDSNDIIYISLEHYNLGKIEIEIEKPTGLYSCWLNRNPVSFHHTSEEEVWIGTTYDIKRYPIDSMIMYSLWKALVDLPHAGHYEK